MSDSSCQPGQPCTPQRRKTPDSPIIRLKRPRPRVGSGCSPFACRSMPRPRKSVSNSRINGSKASNKGKIISTKIPVLCPKVQWRGGDPVVTFETVFRVKIHKNEKYKEQVEAEAWAADAKKVAQYADRGVHVPDKCDFMSVSAARSILFLKAYQEATSDPA